MGATKGRMAGRTDADERSPNGSAVRVLIVDDHVLVADALAEVLESDPDLEVIGRVTNGGDALAQARDTQPDVVLLDHRLGDEDGLELVEPLRAAAPEVQVVCTTGVVGPTVVSRAVSAGCIGFVPKTASFPDLVGTIHAAAHGEPSFGLADVTALITQLQRRDEEDLTARELEVLQLLADGASTRRLTEELNISANTARSHIRGILTKLGAHSKLEALSIALKRGLVDIETGH
jgi:DNA-binding NarL/FixJ family response regulator